MNPKKDHQDSESEATHDKFSDQSGLQGLKNKLGNPRFQSKRFLSRLLVGTLIAISIVVTFVLSLGSSNSPNDEIAQPATSSTSSATSSTNQNLESQEKEKTRSIRKLKSVKGEVKSEYFGRPDRYPGPGHGASSSRTQFLVSADGSHKFINLSAKTGSTCNALTAICTNFTITITDGVVKVGRVLKNSELGNAPDGYGSIFSIMGAIEAIRAAGISKIEEVTYEGQPAWKIKASLDHHESGDLDSVEVIADHQSFFPLRATIFLRGAPIRQETVSNLVLDPEISTSDFTVEISNPIESNESECEEMTIQHASVSAGYKALQPQYIPDGFELRNVCFLPQSQIMHEKGYRKIVSLYRKGLLKLTIITAIDGQQDGFFYNPWLVDEDSANYSRALVTDGFFKGTNGVVVAELLDSPYIIGEKHGISFGIKGATSHEELIKIANSFREIDD